MDVFIGAIAAKNGFTNSLLPAYIDGVNCIGSEASIFECILSYRSDDSVCEAAGVICQGINHACHIYVIL